MDRDETSGDLFLRVPGWDRFPWLRAGFSTRQRGASQVYGTDEQNLGWTREDVPESVARNRTAFLRAVADGADMPLVTVQQIHSGNVLEIDETDDGPWMTEEGRALRSGDGLLTGTPGRLVGVVTADCVPVLVADTRTYAVGVFHAGWRGTLAHIVQHGVERLRERFDARPEDLIAAIGPCIGACCFAVGQEVRTAFAADTPDGVSLFTERQGQIFMDLVEANRRQLRAAGVAEAEIRALAHCTACTRLRDGRKQFFSYRAEQGVTGRMLSVVGAIAWDGERACTRAASG